MLRYNLRSNFNTFSIINNNNNNNILKSFFSNKNNNKTDSLINKFEKFKGNKENNLNLNVIKIPKLNTSINNSNNNNNNNNQGIPILERKKLIKKEKKLEENKIKKENNLLVKKLQQLEKEKKRILLQIEEYDETPEALKLLFEKGLRKKLETKIKEIEKQEIEIKTIQNEKLTDQQQQQQQEFKTIENKKENMISDKDLNTMKLLFGESFEMELSNVNNNNNGSSNSIEQSIDTVVEFSYQDKFYIGLIKNISNNNSNQQQIIKVERLVVNEQENEISKKYQSDIVVINKFDIRFYWKDLFGKMKFNELIELDSQYQDFKFLTNIVNENKLSLFKKEYDFTTDQVAKVLYNISVPSKKQLYNTFKYLSKSEDIVKPKDLNRLGYDFIQIDNREKLDSFIKKAKSVLENKKQKEEEEVGGEKCAIRDPLVEFNYQDIYYLNLLKILSISPKKSIIPDQSFRVITRELGYENTPESSIKLLEDLGFLRKIPVDEDSQSNLLFNKNMGLWTKELYDYAKVIDKKPNEIQDVLKSLRVNFDKPVISIDPSSTLGIDDALSIDCDGSDKFDIVYIHISDFVRWMPDGIDNVLYKSALFNLKTWYPPNGAYHMFPPSLVKTLSLSNATKEQPTYAITVEINFEKSSSKIDSYRIYPTTLTSVIPLSQSTVTQRIQSLINKSNSDNNNDNGTTTTSLLNKDEEGPLSLGEKLLFQLYEFTLKRQNYRRSSNTLLESYGRVNLYKKELRVKQKPGSESNNNFDIQISSLTQKTPYHSIGHEIVDEILSTVDDICTELYQSKGVYGFYKYFGQPNYKRISPKSSFLTLTSPIRNFTHLFTQLQLKNLLLESTSTSSSSFFTWEYTSSIGDEVIKTIRLKKNYQINLVNYVLLKAIQNDIEKQKQLNLNKNKNKKQNSNNDDGGFKATLEGQVLSINPSNFQFAIHLKKFQYSTYCSFTIPQDSSSTKSINKLPFRVNDIVQVSVESLDLNNLSLKLNFLKLKKRVQ